MRKACSYRGDSAPSKSERQDEILAILKKNKYASVQDLGAALYASQPTIRRDLASLEAAGYVMRSHGGVILRDERIDTPVAFRSSTKTHQKMQISHAAANLIGDSRTIFIAASTTASYIAGDIQTSEKLMVVTNSLRVAEELADGAPEVWCTGGRLLRTSLAFVGNQSIRCVTDFCVDIAFFSSSALGADGVIQDYSPEETEIRRTVLRSAAKKVFLCDSSKFGQTSPFRVCAITEVDCVITDAPLPEGIGGTTAFTRTETNGVYLYQRIGNDPNAPKT